MKRRTLVIMAAAALAAGGLAVAYPKLHLAPGLAASGAHEAPLVKVVTVQRQDLVQRLTVSGTLEPSGLQEVRAEFGAGRVRFLVAVGDRIKAGQVLAELDRAQQLQLVASLRASLAKGQARLAELGRQQALEPALTAQKVAAARAQLGQAEQEQHDVVTVASAQVGQARLAVIAVEARQAALQAQLLAADGKMKLAEQAHVQNPDDPAATQAYGEARLNYEGLMSTSQGLMTQIAEETAQAREALLLAEARVRQGEIDRYAPVQAARLKVESARQGVSTALAEAAQGSVFSEQVRAAQADVDMLTQTLEVATNRLESGAIKAPFDGVVVSVALKEGQTVQENEVLLGLGATSQFTLVAQVDERDVANLEPGQDLTVESVNYPGELFPGKIVRVPALPAKGDGASRATQFAVQGLLRNPEGKLRAGMHVDAAITSGARVGVIAVSMDAVRELSGKRYVIVVKDSQVSLRAVNLGLRAGTQAEVLDGLTDGERVVIAPNRLVQTLKEGDRVRVDAAAR